MKPQRSRRGGCSVRSQPFRASAAPPSRSDTEPIEVCDLLGIDPGEHFPSFLELFTIRHAMASERYPDNAEVVAAFDMYIVGIAFGHQLALARARTEPA